ncbi:MAG: FAD-dependent oxidoreductase [Burkholderiales bacterium]
MAADFDVIVIGEGVAGLTVASEIAGAGFKVATLEAQLFGGLVININELDPAPAGSNGGTTGGAEYASSLVEAAANAGVNSMNEPATGIESTGGMLKVLTDGGGRTARHVVIASGARLKKLGVPGEAEFEGKGVSQCADCDGPMYQNESVVVVGGGDSALQEAIVLSHYCKEVHIVHRGGTFTGRDHFQQAVSAEPKITKTFNAEVTAIGGGQMVEKVSVKYADGRAEDVACAGLFAYIGLEPNADFLPDAIKRDTHGFVTTSDTLETATPGVWAVGAVRSGCGGLLDDAIADAKKAVAGIRARLA